MKIGMISWLHGKPVPVAGYGGIERFVEVLTMGLASGLGHEIVLIAPPGSKPPCEVGVEVVETNDMVEAVNILATYKLDVIHDNTCWHGQSPVRQGLKVPALSTTHVNHALGWSKNTVYLSKSQRRLHGQQLNKNLDSSFVIPVPFDPRLVPQDDGYDAKSPYCLYIGAITEHKGVIEAAHLANALGKSLIVCGDAAGPYADALKNMKNVFLIGAVSGLAKWRYIAGAYAVMCLHNNTNGWQEPGCGVVGEANACNVPVMALLNGCLPELVQNNVNGWIANTWQEVLELVITSPMISYSRFYAERHWGVNKIAKDYVWLYEQLLEGESWG